MPSDTDVTGYLQRFRNGDRKALDSLMPAIYAELRRAAHGQLARRRRGGTLNTTALVNEAYLKLIDQSRAEWNDREHFVAAAATAMRHILIDYFRAKKAQKRGGDLRQTVLDDAKLGVEVRQIDVIALGEAMEQLAELDERQMRVVDLRFFVDLSEAEVAEILGISPRTVRREWRMARAFLHDVLSTADESTG